MENNIRAEHKYISVAERFEKLIAHGLLKTGDKLLSVRALSREQGISLSTAFKAYYHLESKGLIEARPQSGYYVKFTPRDFPSLPSRTEFVDDPISVSLDDMITSVYKDLNSDTLLNFTLAAPSPLLLPAAKLNKAILQAIRNSKTSCLNYDDFQGNLDLRKHMAKLAFNWGGTVHENDIVVTAGCMEALAFSLKAVTQPGDAVAIESPTYFGIFQVMESLGLKVVEIPAQPTTGIDLGYLEKAIAQMDIRACLFVTNFNNPLGSLMPDENKAALVDLLGRCNIPLIEDDIYGELYFGKTRPRTCKSFDKKGMVIYCSSFSKSLAPGYRIGWAIPGKFKDAFFRLKRMHAITTNTLTQSAIAHFLNNDRYELHLRHLRKALHTQCLRYIQSITEFFPKDIRLTQPQGGFALWIELDKKINAYPLHQQALKHNIGIVPGQIFSSQGHYGNCFRISYGEPWNKRIEEGLETLGSLAHMVYEKSGVHI